MSPSRRKTAAKRSTPPQRKTARAEPNARKPAAGKIITFYSYKGGTGRTMALANVAWILASRGERVLVIDWDLEAPGLHRYFHPFIDDKELAHSPGLIEFLSAFVEGARLHAGASSPDWFEPYAHLERHAFSLKWDFEKHGTVDLLPAGRQSASYGTNVTSFDWTEFYEKLGGGVLLEAVKRNLRSEYDYVLIDSRTGLSDTSGICTIQMPDELVVCFTLNRQSITGAAAIAESAFQQRITPKRTPGIKIWPVPTRVELAERDRLERARDDVRARFQKFLHHLPTKERADYWGTVEVLYQPFFAYEEVLAVLTERRQQTGSLLQSFERLTWYLTEKKIQSLGTLDEAQRHAAVTAYDDVKVGPFFLSYSHSDADFAERLADALRQHFGANAVLMDRNLLTGGDQWQQALSAAINSAQTVLPLVSKSYVKSETTKQEAAYAIGRGLRIVPVLLPGNAWPDLRGLREPFSSLTKLFGVAFGAPLVRRVDKSQVAAQTDLSSDVFDQHVSELVDVLRGVAADSARRSVGINLDDPHRGRFGSRSERAGYALTATVKARGETWFDVTMRISKVGKPNTGVGDVEFHLHPTFEPSVRRVSGKNGAATLELEAWGAFTVGAVVLKTLTQLELDLSKLPRAPKTFRER